jgi:hypothetical protein
LATRAEVAGDQPRYNLRSYGNVVGDVIAGSADTQHCGIKALLSSKQRNRHHWLS